mgnify:FL=1
MSSIPFMSDIHMHIIPGVDDGSWDMDMSMSLLYMAYEEGIRKIIATSHGSAFAEDDNFVKENFEQLQQRASKLLPPMQLYFGCEIKCKESEMDSILEDLRTEKLPTLNGTKYVLTEFHTSVEAKQAIACATRLLEAGWIPVIAHVERYKQLFMDFSAIEKLAELGCLFQINVYNVYDADDEIMKANALKMIEKQMVSFLGTDSHRTFHRPPSVKYELQYLYETYDKEYLDAIVFKNAQRLLGI